MRAFIYTGGTVYPEFVTEHPRGDDLSVAADSGIRNALLLEQRPDVIVGDFDSYEDKLPENAEIIRLKREKDCTDTQAAVDIALERGAEEIIIIGGLSGRTDHALSNIAILEYLSLKGVHCIITDGCSRIRFIKNTSELIGRSRYKYLSVISLSEKSKGVSIEGCKYPLKNATLFRSVQYAVSNEIDGNCALISVKKGEILIIESRDAGKSV